MQGSERACNSGLRESKAIGFGNGGQGSGTGVPVNSDDVPPISRPGLSTGVGGY